MKRLFSTVLAVAIAMLPLLAQTTERIFKDAFAAEMDDMIEFFDHDKPCHMFAYWYDVTDVDGDGTLEMVLGDYAKEYYAIFKYVDGDVRFINPVPLQNVNWKPIFWAVSDLLSENYDNQLDITLRHRPIFAHDINISGNRYKASSEVWSYVNTSTLGGYDRMIFKPHVGEVRLAKKSETEKAVTATWSLKDPSKAKTMFRGYTYTLATPVIVPNAFLDTHNPLQFSRWLNGEKITHASSDAKAIISEYYGGRRIHEARWVASCPSNERTFYNVVFEPEDGKVLSALVCIAEGDVESVRNQWDDMEGNDLATGESLDDIFFHGPQIMAMIACDAGLELYVRWNSMEGIHYAIWREYEDQWITIQDDYQYLAPN